ncbi:MAG: SusD/RagB family nutrient-binding outer membrane lipoprotein, partial [Cyanobacteria bacterium WB6_1B_304]|nr:SusD/RagB family nutrient-binding outer membrane lipoprotein [Cyanobacteria bacterium WB6_1B_304]
APVLLSVFCVLERERFRLLLSVRMLRISLLMPLTSALAADAPAMSPIEIALLAFAIAVFKRPLASAKAAELALRGYNTGKTPKMHYENAVTASMVQWGVTLPSGFLTQPAVAFPESGTFDTRLERIILQKYIAYFFVDYQSWFEKRRTGYPVLPRGIGIPAANQFPSRAPYPTYLQSLNADNLKAAATAIGGDNSAVKVWWEK